jgi:predicted transglutaminase-like cysteine proteinase
MLVMPSAPARPQAGTARFFSINSVLAKLDGKLSPDQPIRLASATSDNIMSDAPSEFVAIRPDTLPTNEPFGLLTFRAPNSLLWRKWHAVRSDIAAELKLVANCRTNGADCTGAARRFILMVDEARSRGGTARIEAVNRLVNTAIRYMSDLTQHAAVDVWSAPLASFQMGRGDCEDYAIAKYVILREAGVPEKDMRILLVRDRKVREDHAVLVVRNESSWAVLDNRSSNLSLDSELPHFTPLFALDAGGVNLFASPYLTQRLNREAGGVLPASDTLQGEDIPAIWPQEPLAATSTFAEAMPFVGGAGPGTLPVLM